MAIKEPVFQWNEEEGLAICLLKDKTTNKTYFGHAQCHPKDMDMKSKLTGQTIAYRRALIQFFRDLIVNDMRPQLKALKQLYYSIDRSKEYDPKSYIARALKRQIKQREYDIEILNTMVEEQKQEISKMIEDKEKFYTSLRKVRTRNEKL